MTGVAGREVVSAVPVVIGVDTHQDQHVAFNIDQQGVRLAERYAPAASYGYRDLERWSRKLGEPRAFEIEGTCSYGAGLARFLAGRGLTVALVNRGALVNRPDRSTGTGRVRATPSMRRWQRVRCWPE